jgi:DNA-binding GntR family transcriptional regulator
LLEADGLVNTVPHRGPVVSTISLEEAKQLYAARAVLEGFAGRECARLHDPAVVGRIGNALAKLKAAFAEDNLMAALEAKTEFYAALIGGCRNSFIERMLRSLHDRITLLRITSMSQPKRNNKKPARSHGDLARHPKRRPRPRRTVLRRSRQGGRRGRAQARSARSKRKFVTANDHPVNLVWTVGKP